MIQTKSLRGKEEEPKSDGAAMAALAGTKGCSTCGLNAHLTPGTAAPHAGLSGASEASLALGVGPTAPLAGGPPLLTAMRDPPPMAVPAFPPRPILRATDTSGMTSNGASASSNSTSTVGPTATSTESHTQGPVAGVSVPVVPQHPNVVASPAMPKPALATRAARAALAAGSASGALADLRRQREQPAATAGDGSARLLAALGQVPGFRAQLDAGRGAALTPSRGDPTTIPRPANLHPRGGQPSTERSAAPGAVRPSQGGSALSSSGSKSGSAARRVVDPRLPPRPAGLGPASQQQEDEDDEAINNPFRKLREQHAAQASALQGTVKQRLDESVRHLRELNFEKLAELARQTSAPASTPLQAGTPSSTAPPALNTSATFTTPTATAANSTAPPTTGSRGAGAVATTAGAAGRAPSDLPQPAWGTRGSAAGRGQMRDRILGAMERDLRAEGRNELAASMAAGRPGAVTTDALLRDSGAEATLPDSGQLLGQIAQFRTQLDGLGVASRSAAASRPPALAPSTSGIKSMIDAVKSVANPPPAVNGAAPPDLSSLPAQQAVLSVLSSQLGGWQDVAGKFGALNTVIHNFGKTVGYMTSFSDDSTHYTRPTNRGGLVSLLDRDSQRWWRENEQSQALHAANTMITWVGANAMSKSDHRKRFQLEFSDVVIDAQLRPIVVGQCFNPETQLTTLAVGRFTSEGTALDPSFCNKPHVLTEGWMQTNYFSGKSEAVRVALSPDGGRILVLGTTTVKGDKWPTACVLAVNPLNSMFDETFGDKGVQGLEVAGYSGCLGVALSVHPITGAIAVLLRLQMAPGTRGPGHLASALLRLTHEGNPDPTMPLLIFGRRPDSSSANETQTTTTTTASDSGERKSESKSGETRGKGVVNWVATDVVWRLGSDRNDRGQDRLAVSGGIVTDVGQQTALAFVLHLAPDGRPCTSPSTVQEADLIKRVPTASHDVAPVPADEIPVKGLPGERLLSFENQRAEVAPFGKAASQVGAPVSTTGGLAEIRPVPTFSIVLDALGWGRAFGSGLRIWRVNEADGNLAARLCVSPLDGTLWVAGASYPGVQITTSGSGNTKISSDLVTGTAWVARLPEVTGEPLAPTILKTEGCESTVIKALAIHPTSGEVAAVGYCLRVADDCDTADAFVARVQPTTGAKPSIHRLPMVGEFHQQLAGAVYSPANHRLVSCGMFQVGRTTMTRMACLLATFLPPEA